MTDYNIQIIHHKYSNGCDSELFTSITTLNNFCKEYPYAIYINATLKEDICGYDWNYNLSANFSIKIEGHDENKIVKFEWDEGGGSIDCLGDTFICSYETEPCVIYQYDKWYLLEESDYYKDNEKKKEIQKLENEKKQLEINKRRDILTAELNKFGLEFRKDSVLCNNFINGDMSYSIGHIVHKMCKMKYLYEYCFYKDFIKSSVKQKFDKKEIKQKALDKYSDGKFPECFPWIKK